MLSIIPVESVKSFHDQTFLMDHISGATNIAHRFLWFLNNE